MLRNARKRLWGGYGFKLHLVINHTGDLLDVALTPGNIDDRKFPLRTFAERLHGSLLYADRGYISKDLREALREQGVNLVYKVRTFGQKTCIISEKMKKSEFVSKS